MSSQDLAQFSRLFVLLFFVVLDVPYTYFAFRRHARRLAVNEIPKSLHIVHIEEFLDAGGDVNTRLSPEDVGIAGNPVATCIALLVNGWVLIIILMIRRCQRAPELSVSLFEACLLKCKATCSRTPDPECERVVELLLARGVNLVGTMTPHNCTEQPLLNSKRIKAILEANPGLKSKVLAQAASLTV